MAGPTTAELERKLTDMTQVVSVIRDEAEKTSNMSGEFKQKIDNCSKVLDEMKDVNEKLVSEMKEVKQSKADAETKFNEAMEQLKELNEKSDKSEEEKKELLKRIENMEINKARGSKKADNPRELKKVISELPEYKNLHTYALHGEKGFSADEVKALMRSDNDVLGGFTAIEELSDIVLDQIHEISPIRNLATVISMSGKTIEVPIEDSIISGTYEGENEEGGEGNLDFGVETLTAYAQVVNVRTTRDLLMNSYMDIASRVMMKVNLGFSQGENRAFVRGSGHKEPLGFLTDSQLNTNTSSSSGTFTADDLINLSAELKTGYNGVFGFNRKTMAQIMTFKGSDGHYIWQMNLAQGMPNAIAGRPHVEIPDMPDIATGAIPVIFADFSQGYMIADRTGLGVIRDEITFKKKRAIELSFYRYNTGRPVLREAFAGLTIA